MKTNIHAETVEGFGDQWAKFDQSNLTETQIQTAFDQYFEIFDFDGLPSDAVGFDFGCGSGRWAKLVAPKVGKLHVIDASDKALQTARENLKGASNCYFHWSSEVPLADNYADFGYSLGVLHHIPDTEQALQNCVRALKPGAPFLLYVYYNFENRNSWFRLLWRASDIFRRFISRLPFPMRYTASQVIALLIYFPLARAALLAEKLGFGVSSFPLSVYRNRSFYEMRTDAHDRFGTQLEKRFSKRQVEQMMTSAGLHNITFSEQLFWTAVGYKK